MKRKGNIVSYTMEEIKQLPSRTDIKRLKAMRDEDIDTSDIPPITAEEWKTAKLVRANKKAVSIRLDPDILAWLKSGGKGYQRVINAVLRDYMESHKS